MVLFEAPGRLAATLADLADACGPDRGVVVARELTKLHEEVWRGTLGDASRRLRRRARCGARSWWCWPATPTHGRAPDDADVADALRRRLEAGDTLRDAAAAVAGELGVSRAARLRPGPGAAPECEP